MAISRANPPGVDREATAAGGLRYGVCAARTRTASATYRYTVALDTPNPAYDQNGAGPRPANDINTCVASSLRMPVTVTVPTRS